MLFMNKSQTRIFECSEVIVRKSRNDVERYYAAALLKDEMVLLAVRDNMDDIKVYIREAANCTEQHAVVIYNEEEAQMHGNTDCFL